MKVYWVKVNYKLEYTTQNLKKWLACKKGEAYASDVVNNTHTEIKKKLTTNSESQSESLPVSRSYRLDPPVQSQLSRHCLRFPQHFPKNGFCNGCVQTLREKTHRCWAADKASCRAFPRSAVSSFPEQHQEAAGANTQGIGWSDAHGL